jgi:2-phosphoglycolate phosphatase
MTNVKAAVLFDLDGTLVDTALDMVGVLFDMLDTHGGDKLPYELARASVSNGSLALIRLAFPAAEERSQLELQQEYLDRYEKTVCRDSVLFPGMPELIDTLDRNGLPWGIVTNKPGRLTQPLLEQLNILERAACAISGDTLPERKPHPAPLLLASRQIGIKPEKTIYVGDAQRDIEAGRRAGMSTIGVTYGYITAEDDPDLWGADEMAADTKELTKILLKAVNVAH